MAKTHPEITIVIPSYNEASYIDRLLDALAGQTHKNFEVIISDAQSKDGTDKVVHTYQDKLNITLLQSPPQGPAHGRNEGAAAAKGDWLLFLDADDDISDTSFIETLLRVTRRKGWQTATAKQYYINARLVDKAGARLNYWYTKMLARSKHPVAPGWCILTKRSLFEELNGFNEKIQFGEDYDYVSRAGHKGFGFVTDTSYLVDMRRAREEGWRLALKGTLNEIYRHTHGYNLENNPYKYEFGKHKTRSK